MKTDYKPILNNTLGISEMHILTERENSGVAGLAREAVVLHIVTLHH